MGKIRRRWTKRAQWPEFYRARVWRAPSGRLLGPRPHRGFAIETRRRRLEQDFRGRRRALVSYRRYLLRSFREHAYGCERSDASGKGRRHRHFLRLELSPVALAIRRRKR